MKQNNYQHFLTDFILCHEAKENIQDLNYRAAQTIELAEIVSFDASPVNKINTLFLFIFKHDHGVFCGLTNKLPRYSTKKWF